MNKKEFKTSIDKLEPTEAQKNKMFDNIVNKVGGKSKPAHKKIDYKIAAVSALAAVVCLTIIIYPMFNKSQDVNPKPSSTKSNVNAEIAQVTNQFEFEGKLYVKADKEYIEEWMLDNTSLTSRKGSLLGTIDKSPDKSLLECNIYSYMPLNSDAVIIVDKNNSLELFRFVSFESYMDNSDEDAAMYLDVYNIKSHDDIHKIEIFRYPTATSIELTRTVTDKELIKEFYEGFAALKNSSDRYFDAISNYSTPKPMRTPTLTDSGYITHPYEGAASKALGNTRAIKIYFTNGLNYETQFYPNIGFMSRFELTEEYCAFVKELCLIR